MKMRFAILSSLAAVLCACSADQPQWAPVSGGALPPLGLPLAEARCLGGPQPPGGTPDIVTMVDKVPTTIPLPPVMATDPDQCMARLGWRRLD